MCQPVPCPKCQVIFELSKQEAKVIASGTGFDGERTTHWANYEQMCPVCKEVVEWSESD